MMAVLLMAGLVLRVVTQVAYRPALLYIDSPKYLVTGLLSRSDPQGYRDLLLVPVLWAGNLATVAAVQHLLGLAAVLNEGFTLSDQGDAILYGRVAAAADCAALRLPAAGRPLCPPPRAVAALGIDGLVNDPSSPIYAVLLGADMYEFSWRYQLPALVILPAAGASGMTVLAQGRRRRQ